MKHIVRNNKNSLRVLTAAELERRRKFTGFLPPTNKSVMTMIGTKE